MRKVSNSGNLRSKNRSIKISCKDFPVEPILSDEISQQPALYSILIIQRQQDPTLPVLPLVKSSTPSFFFFFFFCNTVELLYKTFADSSCVIFAIIIGCMKGDVPIRSLRVYTVDCC